MKLSRIQSKGEEIANSVSHIVGGAFGIVGTVLLIVKARGFGEVMGAIIFGFGMIMLYTMSALYHAFREGSTVKRIFQRFDHIGIYLLIGGTFAPIFIIAIEKPLGWLLLAGQWIIIALGITFKAVKIRKFAVLHLALFLLLGWSGMTLVGPLYALSTGAFWFILIGGISYTIGVLFYAFNWFKFAHFIWHIFVFMGTLSHFVAVYFFLM
ncbi:MAG TPA: hemolysin III [Acholeplasmatales bacterium]|nr:hemolysin III [Acholeplasmatales bacterium]